MLTATSERFLQPRMVGCKARAIYCSIMVPPLDHRFFGQDLASHAFTSFCFAPSCAIDGHSTLKLLSRPRSPRPDTRSCATNGLPAPVILLYQDDGWQCGSGPNERRGAHPRCICTAQLHPRE